MRLVIVSNRLPTIVAWDKGDLTLKGTAGGLVSGMAAWLARQKDIPWVWVGWPGTTVPDGRQEEVRMVLEEKHAAIPVFLSESAMDQFYLGFCNRTIWPLFHYFQSYVACEPDSWQMYREVNQTFLEAMRAVLRPGDVVWIHDYHLMLLPALLREHFPDIAIGFFLHIPFPSVEVFRLLPSAWRREILEGLLGADLIGFHTQGYTRNFVKCVRRMAGHESHLGSIRVDDRVVMADIFPMGIDYRLFADTAASAPVREERARLEERLRGLKMILSIDRLDYSKGIPDRLRGYARFLEKYPEWHGKVCLGMVVVPSRIGVDQYQVMKREIDELVGSINGKYGDVGWTPIRYQYRMLGSVPLSALYAASDVALVTPLRDGMNLVAKEYVASRGDAGGVLVLSEMAGAAREMGEALIVNPGNPDEIADALLQALEMPLEEQKARIRALQARLERYDVHWWADDFLRVLEAVKGEQEIFAHLSFGGSLRHRLIDEFAAAKNRLLILDYDGTLVPFKPRPELAVPDVGLMCLLEGLLRAPGTLLAITSGRAREELDRWFGHLPVVLAAEHGAMMRTREGAWTRSDAASDDWKKDFRPILQSYADRLSGAFVEEKDFSLAWHYRNADPELGRHRADQLVENLTARLGEHLRVQLGNRVVEVRCAGFSKGTVASSLLGERHWDFVFAAGDDWTDEDMMRVLPSEAWSIKVGPGRSRARFNLPGPEAVVTLLEEMAAGTAADVATATK